MATKSQFQRDCQAANDSKAAALAFHASTPLKHERTRVYCDMCRDAGMPGYELAGQLLELIEWKIRESTCAFGAYDTAEKIAIELGCSPDQVRRRVAKLKAFGLIETALGIPRGRTGPTVHYRLTAKLCQILGSMVAAIRRAFRTAKTTVAKAPKLALQVLSTKNRRPKKPFMSQATRIAAHQPFQKQQPHQKSAPEVGNSWISGIRALRAER